MKTTGLVNTVRMSLPRFELDSFDRGDLGELGDQGDRADLGELIDISSTEESPQVRYLLELQLEQSTLYA